jgi:hypothetical protein
VGLLDALKGNKGRLRPYTCVGLTEIGKAKANAMNQTGAAFDILNTLNDKGPSTILEIAEDNNQDSNKVLQVCEKLIQSSYIRDMSRGQGTGGI